MGVEKLSLYFANRLGKRLDKSQEEIAVLNYGFFMIIQTIYSIVCIFIVGVLTGLLKEILLISICSAMLKRSTGGVHASTPNRCLFIGIFIATLLTLFCGYLTEQLGPTSTCCFGTVMFIITYYIIYTRCPVGSKHKPLKKETIRNRLRKKSFELVNVYLIIEILIFILYITQNNSVYKSLFLSIIFGIFMQIFALSKIGEKFIVKLDKFFDIIKEAF